jgi:murein DD-endopeptidase MepM/ murein hydrolase activator NlpD
MATPTGIYSAENLPDSQTRQQAAVDLNKQLGRNPTFKETFEYLNSGNTGTQTNSVTDNTAQTNNTDTTEPTVGEVFGNFVPGQNQQISDAEKRYLDILNEQTAQPNEAEIRQNTMDRFQAEIDALNRVYAEKKAAENIRGEGRIGSGTAIQARRGLIGSDFGASQTEKVKDFNTSIISGLEAEQNAAINSILSEVRNSAAQELAAKTAARKQGATEYLTFLQGQEARKAQRIADTVDNALFSGVEISDAQFAQMAQELGVDPAMLKAQYNKAKIANTAATETEKSFTVAPGASVYDPTTGTFVTAPGRPENFTGIVAEYEYYKDQEEAAGRTPLSFNDYQTADANRKARAERALIGGIDPTLVNLGISFGTRFDNAPIVKQFNEVQNKKLGVDRLLSEGIVGGAQDVALVFDFMKALDPTSVVRESEYDTASKSGNLFVGALAKFNGLFKESGGKLSDEVRNEFQKIINQKYGTVKQQYANLYSENQRKMEALGIDDPAIFLTDYTGAETTPDSPTITIDEEAVAQLIQELGITRQEAIDALDFNQPLSMGVNGSDVSGIRDEARVATVLGTGTATGIESGSSVNAYGFDLVLEGGKGAPTKSPIDGKVISVLEPSQTGGFGRQVKIQSSDGRIWTVNHLDGFNVKKGDTVQRGTTVIGRQGNTGTVLTKDRATGQYRTPTASELAAGKGTHLDITVYNNDGSKLSSREVASLLGTKQIA